MRQRDRAQPDDRPRRTKHGDQSVKERVAAEQAGKDIVAVPAFIRFLDEQNNC